MKIKQINKRLSHYIERNIYFKPYFFRRIDFLAEKVLLRLAEKPAVNFLKPAVTQKKRGLRVLQTISTQCFPLSIRIRPASKTASSSSITDN